MRTESAPQVRRLADYAPPAWLVETVTLAFDLKPKETRVVANVRFRRNPASTGPGHLRLDGRALRLISASIDGEPLGEDAFTQDEDGLTIPQDRLPPGAFEWRAETEIDPADNTSLEGLYLSKGMFCTQCEAEGFRKITFFPDRPDVLAIYEVHMTAPQELPVLLSNGDPVDAGELPDGRRFARWRDPHPKPSYLFALVAGDLVAEKRDFRTQTARDVELALWVRRGDEGKTGYALDSLERAMRWDEEVYGRAYDLDVFNVVAVDDFNMGAMENKGLNIFNSKYVLASPETATDKDYEVIESVVAHEYFHNWTGNRITCRDWFQLCLKEGLTVFRDQQFTADMRSEPVKRIEDVLRLRAQQFREDAGPLAHAVRPEEYSEINNFYTSTVYEKGAEVIRMLRLIVGPEAFRKALDLYFERHDGQAATIEQFRRCFEDVTGRDLSHFALWWSQAGTPSVRVSDRWEEEAGRYILSLRQETPPTAGQPKKKPVVIPVALGLLGPEGEDLLPEGTRVVELDVVERQLVFENLPARPVPSLLRGFSAPVRLERTTTDAERAFLAAHDSDPFNRWEAARNFGRDVALQMLEGAKPDPHYIAALGALATDSGLDPAFRALALEPPGEEEIAREVHAQGRPADPEKTHSALLELRRAIAGAHKDDLAALHGAMATPKPYRPDAASAGRRALRNRAMALLATLGPRGGFPRAIKQFRESDNMSEQAPALMALAHHGAPEASEALEDFYERWKGEPLVVDKWLSIQATAPRPETLEKVRALTEHPAFDWLNPNKFRALIGAFALANPSRFHASDGSGYVFLADWLIRLDPRNPQTTARLASAFETWRRYDERRQSMIRAQLERIAGTPGLSKNTAEIVRRTLAA